MIKEEYAEEKIRALMFTLKKAFNAGNYDKVLMVGSICAWLEYIYNQLYYDKELEDFLCKFTQLTIKQGFLKLRDRKKKDCKRKVVLFYDGFGLDLRGLAFIYLRALCESGYKVVYVTCEDAKGRQLSIEKILRDHCCETVYIDLGTKICNVQMLLDVIDRFSPEIMFFYSLPNDIVGYIAFLCQQGRAQRFFINVSDHSFWIGQGICDHYIEFRNYGFFISSKYRDVVSEKLLIQPYYPIIFDKMDFQGWPFLCEGKRVIFSGGSLYKTLGDPDKRYYKIVRYILSNHEDVVFVYAGGGDDTELKKVLCEYPDRAYHIDERADLFQVLKHSYLYLSTYPFGGGLMMQYAVAADCIPLTFVTDDSLSGILLSQREACVEYFDLEDMLHDIDRLFLDKDYYYQRKLKLKNQIISEERFRLNLKTIVENFRSDFIYSGEEYDVMAFKKQYVERLDRKEVDTIIGHTKNIRLFFDLPKVFLNHWIDKVKALCNLD